MSDVYHVAAFEQTVNRLGH